VACSTFLMARWVYCLPGLSSCARGSWLWARGSSRGPMAVQLKLAQSGQKKRRCSVVRFFARSNTLGPFGIVNGPQIYDADIRNGK
jgi:hypothetical protein